jgi:hypothetical protein
MGSDHREGLRLSTRGDDRAYIGGPLADHLGTTNSEAEQTLAARLSASYPTATEAIRVEEFGSIGSEEPGALVSWVDCEGERRKVEDVFPPFLGSGGGAILPPALSSGDVIEPVAAWWAVLLALSSVARYRPDLWRASLDRDRTPIAIAVEDGIARTRELMPIIVMWAITGQGWNR